MIIKNLEIFSFSIPLLMNLTVKGPNIRKGYIIKIIDEQDNAGYGEVAPLPGLHKENLQNVLDEIIRERENILHHSYTLPDPVSEIALTSPFSGLLSPSLRTGLEMAMFNLKAEATKTPLVKLFSDTLPNPVPVNGLIAGISIDWFAKIKTLSKAGYTTIKIKIGKSSIKEEAIFVNKISHQFPDMKIRLDANRSMTLSDALLFAEKLEGHIEYIEEPVKDPHNLEDFARNSGMPVALDESLHDNQTAPLQIPEWAAAVIIKPSVIGGIYAAIESAINAMIMDKKVVFSSAFESGFSLNFYTAMSSVLAAPLTAAGLDTWRWLANDIVIPPFKTSNGFAEYHENNNSILNHHILERVV